MSSSATVQSPAEAYRKMNAREHDNLLSAITSEKLKLNDEIVIAESETGAGGSERYKVVLASSVTVDDFDYVACTGVPSLALSRKENGTKYLRKNGLGVGLNFIQQLNLDQRDVFMLIQSDSTANDAGEWVRLVTTFLASKYKSYTVLYYIWNEAINDYDNASNQGVGSGVNTLHIYNGSKGGAASDYFLFKQAPNAFAGKLFDLIIQSYGHNQGNASVENMTYTYAESVSQLIYKQPQAEIVLTLQNLWGDDQTRSAKHADATNKVSRMFGCNIIDARSVTLWKRQTGNINDWLVDGLHPNAIGQNIWARIVTDALMSPIKQQSALINSLANKAISPIPNSHFLNWDWSANVPQGGWVTQNSIATRELSIFETVGGSVKLTGTTTATGFFKLEFDDYLQKADLNSGLTFMARVYYAGAWVTTEVSRLEIVTNLGFERSNGRKSNALLQEGWTWKYVHIPASKLIGATSLDLFIWAGRTGDFVYIDRINLVEGMLPREIQYNDQETFLEYYFDENVGSNANNTITVIDDAVTLDSSIAANGQYYINMYGLEVGEQYTLKWSTASSGGGVLFREGMNDSGTVIKTVTGLQNLSATFRATKQKGSIQIYNTLGSLPFTLSNLELKKGV